MKNYHINIFYSEEDGVYIADIPDLKICSAFGETPEEALKAVGKPRPLGWTSLMKRANRFLSPNIDR